MDLLLRSSLLVVDLNSGYPQKILARVVDFS